MKNICLSLVITCFLFQISLISCSKNKQGDQQTVIVLKSDAGSDRVVVIPRDTITIHGSGYVSGGSIVSYQWTKIIGPSQVQIMNSSLASTLITGFVEGTYKFRLTVMDGRGVSADDTMSVEVTTNDPCNGCWDY